MTGERGNRHRLRIYRPSQLQPREGKQVLDQPHKAAALLRHAAYKVERIVGRDLLEAAFEEAKAAIDRGHRRPKLVRDDAEELVLRLIRLSQLFLDLLRFRVQAGVVEHEPDASRDELDTPPTVVLPPDAPEVGNEFLPISIRTLSIGRPRVSAITMVHTVRVPVPRSCVPDRPTTDPSGLIVTLHCESWPWPPHMWIDRPTPRLIGPAALSPRACQRSLHLINSAALSISFASTSASR